MIKRYVNSIPAKNMIVLDILSIGKITYSNKATLHAIRIITLRNESFLIRLKNSVIINFNF